MRDWRGQKIRFKRVTLPDGSSRTKPEFDDVAAAAKALLCRCNCSRAITVAVMSSLTATKFVTYRRFGVANEEFQVALDLE